MAIPQEKLKKTRNPGVFRRPDGRLLAKVSVRTPDGKVVVRKQLMPVGATEKDAVQAVLTMKEVVRNPPAIHSPRLQDTSQTFEDFCNRWLAIRSQRVTPKTKMTYFAVVKTFILPRLGHMICKDIRSLVIESWVVWAESLRKRNGKPYTQESMRVWYRVLHAILRSMAINLHLPDPTPAVPLPHRGNLPAVRESGTLTADEISKLLDACREKFPRRLAEVAVMALTGARAGEVYGLKWDAVNFDRKTIRIKRAVSAGVLMESTKTKAERVVPLHPELEAILMEHVTAQIDRNAPGLDTFLVFPSNDGKVREPMSGTWMWRALAKAAGIKQRVGPQVLRRSLNTLMLAQGVDRITLRAIMGHTTEAMTQLYAGVGDDAKADAIVRVRPVLRVVQPDEDAEDRKAS